MINTKELMTKLTRDYRVKKLCGVPCSNLKYLIREAISQGVYRPFTNEGEAVSYAAGRFVAGEPTALLIQNSGLTNSSSPISSLTSLYDIPMIYLIGYRGYEGVPDEPQHAILGPNTCDIIKSITKDSHRLIVDLQTFMNNDYSDDLISRRKQIFVLVKKGELSPVECSSTNDYRPKKPFLSRKDVIEIVAKILETRNDTRIVSTTGYTSRELISICGESNPNNFYSFGSMGCAYSFTKGLAEVSTDKNFIVLDGDGSTAMRFESSITDSPSNIFRIIINNGQHQSTGGQEFDFSQFSKVLKFIGYEEVETKLELNDYISRFFCNHNIKGVVVNTNDEVDGNLPRPKDPMCTILKRFSDSIY